MSAPPKTRRVRFTLPQLFVVVALLGSAIPLVFSWIERARIASRQAQCERNLRYLGIGVHNYHDVNSQLPPSYSGKDSLTWAASLQPFLDSAHFRFDESKPATSPANLKEVNAYRNPGFVCPVRPRATAAVAVAGVASTPSDYCNVGATTWDDWLGPGANGVLVRAKAITSASPGILFWLRPQAVVQSATTFASVTDGLANTAMFGEKHVTPAGVLSPRLNVHGGDGPVMLGRTPYFMRIMGRGVGRPLAYGPNDTRRDLMFGSWHPGVCPFVMADASVKQINNRADLDVLSALGGRNDNAASNDAAR